MHLTRVLLAAGLVALGAAPARAQVPAAMPIDSVRDDRAFDFYARGPYRAGVPRPDSVIGYAIGSWHTQYDRQQRALLAIAEAAKDRVVVEQVATTNELRPMRLFVVSHPDNIARLDAIRADLDRLADPRGKSQAELDALAARVPAVVWFAGSVHGDEVPGYEASMPLLYTLAASDDAAIVEALRKTIVIVNPASNPDGHERFAVWYNSLAPGSPDAQSIEHQRWQPWAIRGRYNHYRFDMNRDVFATTQKEVQGLVRGMLRWHPMVSADLHGYTTQYYMAPAAAPINQNIGPQATDWLERIGRGNAAAFDRQGWGYYVRDVFDLYYPGYYDTWPSLNGAIGMTYETDGGPGLLQRRDDGTLLSLRDGIAKHFVAALTTFETTAAGAQDRVRGWARYRQGAVSDARTGGMRRVVFVPGADPQRAAELAAMLLRQGIEVQRTTAPATIARARAYGDGGTRAQRVEAGAYVVDLAQPQGRLARAILEESPVLDPTFAKTQVDRYRRNLRRGKAEGTGEGYEFYDITAWALPVAFGVEAWYTDDAGAIAAQPLSLPAADPGPAGVRARDALPTGTDLGGGITGANPSSVAYVFSSERAQALALAWQLLDEGFRVAVATQPIEAGGRNWPRGTFVVRAGRNDATLPARLDALARERGIPVIGLASGYPETAQYGIWSESTVSLTTPKVAMLADEGVDLRGYGATWWGLERLYGIRFTPINLTTLGGGDLSRYNVIIVTDASGGALQQRLGTSGLAHLKTWIRGGGTLVTMGGATEWAATEAAGLTTARALGSDVKPDTTGAGSRATPDTATRRGSASDRDQAIEEMGPFASPSASNDTPVSVPGAHMDVALDRTHWLTYGYTQPRMTVLFGGSSFLKLSREGSNVAVFPRTGTLVRAGFTWPDNTERLLRGTAFLIEEPTGRGHVVLFNNEPMFRGWWRALDRMVLNAIVLGPTF